MAVNPKTKYNDCEINFHWMTHQINFNEACKRKMLIRLITFSLRRSCRETGEEKWFLQSNVHFVLFSIFNQTISFCSNLLDLHCQQKENHKKQQIIESKAVKWDDTFFGPEKLLFWPWCSCPGPAREPRFLPLWEQIDKCGDCAEPYQESCCAVHRATTLQHRASSKRATKTLLTSH